MDLFAAAANLICNDRYSTRSTILERAACDGETKYTKRKEQEEVEEEEVEETEAQGEQKGEPTRSTCTRAIFFVLSLPPPSPPPSLPHSLVHTRPLHSRSSRRNAPPRKKKRKLTPATRRRAGVAIQRMSRAQNKPPPRTPSPPYTHFQPSRGASETSRTLIHKATPRRNSLLRNARRDGKLRALYSKGTCSVSRSRVRSTFLLLFRRIRFSISARYRAPFSPLGRARVGDR